MNKYKVKLLKNIKYCLRFLSDENYVKLYYKLKFRKKLNFDNPQTFNEKLQWLKFNYRDPIFSIVVDKFAVRKYIEKKGFGHLLIPIYGVWNDFDKINFDELPEKFVLKCNHDSGNVVICTNREEFDENYAKKIINRSLKKNFFYVGREWQYKNIHPLIICEKFIGDKNISPIDYKIMCFNGVPDNIMICVGRETGNTKYIFFDTDWNLLPYNKCTKEIQSDVVFPKPKNLDYMIEIAKKLASPFYFSRIDLYNINGKIYFGEITLCPNSGFDSNILENIDLELGNKLILPTIDKGDF